MAMSVNTNVGAMVALQNLTKTNDMLQTTQNRISTGMKVASSRDDSSSWTIAQNIRGDLGGMNAIEKSLGRAKSTLDLAVTAGESISDLLVRARELTVQASDLGIDVNTRDALARDFSNLMKQVDSQVQSSEYNGVNMLKSAPDGIAAILSMNADSSADRFSVQGADLRTSSNNATTKYDGTQINNVQVAGINVASGTVLTSNADTLAGLMSKRAMVGQTATAVSGGYQLATSVKAAFVKNAGTADGFLAGAGGVAFVDDTSGNINIRLQDRGAAALNTITGSTNNTAAVANYGAAEGVVRITFGGITFQANVEKGLTNGSSVTLKPDQFTAVGINTATATQANTAAASLTAVNVAAFNIDLNKFEDRMGATSIIDNYQNRVKNQLGSWGSSARQLDMQLSYSSKLRDTWETGLGSLVDADLAQESAKLQGLQVRQQLGTQALSLANQAPQSLLSLFR